MARTKNRGFKQSFSPSYTVRRWRLGAYIRLSKEDLKKVKEGKVPFWRAFPLGRTTLSEM